MVGPEGRMNRWAKIIGWVLLILYAAWLLKLAVFRPGFGHYPFFSGRWEWIPFSGFTVLWRSGVRRFCFLFFGNIACFIPFGFGLPALTPLRRSVIPLCFLGSFLIEYAQYVFGTGYSQTEDLILNTLGGALGYGLLLWRFRQRRMTNDK